MKTMGRPAAPPDGDAAGEINEGLRRDLRNALPKEMVVKYVPHQQPA